METGIRSDRHFWSSLIYVMHNPVKHRYVRRWQDWPFSNAAEWLESTGRDEAVLLWNEFPIDDFGRDWDPPDL
jgi:putative transposase